MKPRLLMLPLLMAATLTSVIAIAAQADLAPKPSMSQTWQALILPLCYAGVGLLRYFLPKLPVPVVLIAGPVLGVLLDVLGGQIGVWDPSGVLGGLLGTTATWVHQLGKQSGVIGKNPPISDEKNP